MRSHNHQTNQNTKKVGKGISAIAFGLAELTRGAANPMVIFKQFNSAVSFVPKGGSGESGVPSAAYVAVLLYESRVRLRVDAR